MIVSPSAHRVVVVGSGPTGVEMAGQIAELARDMLCGDFRSIDPRQARVLLVEAATGGTHGVPAVVVTTRCAPARAPRRHADARAHGRRRRRVGSHARRPGDRAGVHRRPHGIWAPGVTASGVAELTGAELDRASRIAPRSVPTAPGRVIAFDDRR
jgi:NADH dehydrogenase